MLELCRCPNIYGPDCIYIYIYIFFFFSFSNGGYKTLKLIYVSVDSKIK